MDRREALHGFGAAAVGLTGSTALANHDNDASKDATPPAQLHGYLCAFHIAKKDPKFVIEAHHYCCAIAEEVHQCVIFDSNGKNARILGVEYIITDKLYRSLPDAERKYYHPHSYEVISGLLIAPGMEKSQEKKFMEGLLTTWGKTWHTWPDHKAPLPMGEPLLMWAATKDGQISQELLSERDRKFKVSTPEIRRSRSYLGPVPQIEAPKSVDEIGRQFTNEGPDVQKRN